MKQNVILQSDHEYESAAEDSALDESEDIDTSKDQIKATDQNGQNGQNDNDEGILDLSDKEDIEEEPTEERGAGDGQEEKGAKVDDDEDRRNPQYIPKKGMFYEHDDRIDSEDEAAAKEKTEDEQSAKKRVPRSEATEKWGHDKFLEREQIPKSKEELVNVYGYDIRNEDNAPRARRRRRYGRGPNKYTRNWEDEEAYDSKPPPKENSAAAPAPNSSSRGSKTPRGRGGRGGGQVDRRPVKNAPIKSDDQEDFPPLESKETKREQREPIEAKPKSNAPSTRGGRGGHSNREGGRSNNDSRKAKHQNKSDSSANQRLQKEPRPIESSKQPQRHEKSVEAKLEKEFTAKAKIVDEHKASKDSPRSKRKTDEENSRPSHQPQQQQQPKRYSNSRNSHNRNNNRQEYYNDMNGTSANNYVPAPQAAATHLPNSGPPPAAPFLTPQNVAATPTSNSGFLDPTTMVNYGPPPPVQFTPVAVPVTVTVPLVTAAVPPTVHDTLPVLAPPLNPNVTNAEVLLAAAAAAGATPQGYAEVRGGVTYFNPTAQPHPMMARPVSKRPKAAIPIVDPSQVAGQASMMSPQSSTEEENELEQQQQQPQLMVASNT